MTPSHTLARSRSLTIVILACAGGCGPSTRGASIAVLLATAGIVILANALLGLLWLPWRRVRPELGFRWWPFAGFGLAASALGLLAAVLPHGDEAWEWVFAALVLAGCSYLTVASLLWRIRLRRRDPLGWAHAIAGVVILLPAVPAAFFGSPTAKLGEELAALWILPGYGGMVTGPLYGLLLLEALVRWRRARRVTQA